MIMALCNLQVATFDTINEPMFFVDAPGPPAGEGTSQGFRFANARKR